MKFGSILDVFDRHKLGSHLENSLNPWQIFVQYLVLGEVGG
jgi:hypothetical protein